MKEKERNEIPEIDSRTHKRILGFVNAARRPEDLTADLTNVVQIKGYEEDPVHEVSPSPLDKGRRGPVIDLKVAKCLFEYREQHFPTTGFTHVKQLFDIKNLLDIDAIRALTHFFSGATYGNWKLLPYETPDETPDGHHFSVEHAALLRTGRVIFLGHATFLWDPTDEVNPVFDSPSVEATDNLYCCGHTFLSDGWLLAAGGGGCSTANAIAAGWKFNPIASTWTKCSDEMGTPTTPNKRWYPTCVTLGDEPGRVLIASGGPSQMEIYAESTDSFLPVTVTGGVTKSFPQTYPGLHLLPGGEIFYAPTGFRNCNSSPGTYASIEESGYFKFTGPTTGYWTNTGHNDRTKGMSVLVLQPSYPFVSVMVVGGGDATTSTTSQMINLSTLAPSWGAAIPLPDGLSRINPNVVLLPDGTVFVCGGRFESAPEPDGGTCWLFDSQTSTWAEMASLNYPRAYHSVALLLPSGKVAVTGGSPNGCSHSDIRSIEIFNPPYLFRGSPPTIANVPSVVHHGAAFEIETPDAADIAKVVLVRPMSVTHQTDMEQRVVHMVFSQSGPSKLNTMAPDGVHPHAMAPRGYYMLFILNSNGVPSESTFIHLH